MPEPGTFSTQLPSRQRKPWRSLGLSGRPDARALLLLARHLRGRSALSDDWRILTVSPSRANWAEELTVQAEVTPRSTPYFLLRIGAEVLRIEPRSTGKAIFSLILPAAPSDVAPLTRAQLFLAGPNGSSAPVRLEILAGPVLRKVTRTENEEWRLEGAGFGESAKHAKIMLPGARKARIISIEPTAILFEADLGPRTPVRVIVDGRPSNTVQTWEGSRGRVL